MNDIFGNHALNAALIGWFVAQLLKGIFASIKAKKLLPERFFGSGGMPSSHSSMVSALLITVLLVDGFTSTNVAIVAIFAFITVYDAAGVRYAVGEQAKIINQIILNEDDIVRDKLLKELVGHTKTEVFVGCILGISIAVLYWLFFIK